MKTSSLFLAAAVLVSLLAGCAQPATPTAAASGDRASRPAGAWNVRDHVPLDRFVMQAHRGAGVMAPENTIEAFRLGWSLGVVPESDVRTTSDGVIVAFHDNNFKRVVKDISPAMAGKGVGDVTFAELSQLDVGGWQGEQFRGRRVSRMTEVFAEMRGRPARRLYMDIKSVDLKQLAAEVREYGVGAQVVFTSPKHELIRAWKQLVPDSDTLLWVGGVQEDMARNLGTLRGAQFEGITQLQLHVRANTNGVSGKPFNLAQSFIRDTGVELRSRGILFQSLPWGMSNAPVYWQLMDLGVASFATDYPDLTLKAVRDYYQRP